MATTRSKKIEKGISADYVTAKLRLQREKKSLQDGLDMIEHCDKNWKLIVKTQKEFAELIETEAAIEGQLHEQATKTTSSIRSLHHLFVGNHESKELEIMKRHINNQISEYQSIETEYKKVETEYNETQRYEKKVEKLSQKEKNTAKLASNKTKLGNVRTTYQSILETTMTRMNNASQKYEPMLQTVQTAFWIAQNQYLVSVTEKTADTIEHANQIVDDVVKMDPKLQQLEVADEEDSSEKQKEEKPADA